ncbi:MAG: hypothetical protein JW976_13840 [Syntrophaceae bacterium]|nr:hypothetical protein [Syntrophaceae bacterium]
MRITTEEQLTDKLCEEQAWRKKELANLRALLESKKDVYDKEKVLSRCGIAILYAHWEGFIRHAAESYLEFVSMQGLKHRELRNNFLSILIREKLKKGSDSLKSPILDEVTKFFMTELDAQARVPYRFIIDTQSNLSSTVLREIMYILGLDYKPYETKGVIIDKKLLDRRNHIAHGSYLIVDIKEYFMLHDAVIEMINLFKNQIENAVCMKQYARTAIA